MYKFKCLLCERLVLKVLSVQCIQIRDMCWVSNSVLLRIWFILHFNRIIIRRRSLFCHYIKEGIKLGTFYCQFLVNETMHGLKIFRALYGIQPNRFGVKWTYNFKIWIRKLKRRIKLPSTTSRLYIRYN